MQLIDTDPKLAEHLPVFLVPQPRQVALQQFHRTHLVEKSSNYKVKGSHLKVKLVHKVLGKVADL